MVYTPIYVVKTKNAATMALNDMTIKQVLHHSIYRPLPYGHGGEKRTAQIYEEAQQQGVQFCNLHFTKNEGITIRRLWLSVWLLICVYGIAHWKSLRAFLKQVRNTAIHYDRLLSFFRDTDNHIFVWESVRPEWYILPYLAHKYGKAVVACPHNTESLVPDRNDLLFNYRKQQTFERELTVLKHCEQVFVISREETWLLRLWGVNAYYLPYYPAIECRDWLLDIRKQRAIHPKTNKPTYLVIGSAINQPTAIGMQQLVDYVVSHNMNIVLRIGGYGTDQHICVPKDCGNVVLLGELEQDQLTQEMIECDAILINQPPTTGALTRIVEAEIAGIPVVANTDSMRNYFNILGIYEYRQLDELADVLSQELQVPSIPTPPDNKVFDK